MSIDRWALPGPGAFAQSIVDRIVRGSSAVLLWPARKPTGFGAVLRRLDLRDRNLRSVRGRQDDTPIDAIYRAALGEVPTSCAKSPKELTGDDRLYEAVVHVSEVEGAAIGPWIRFIEDFAGHARSNPPGERLVIVIELEGEQARDPPKPDVALDVSRWDDWVDESDAYLLAAATLRGHHAPPKRRALAIATVARLAIWDLELADALCGVSAAQLVRPNEFLLEWAQKRGWTTESRPSWEGGSTQMVDGVPTSHSAILAVTDSDALDRRVWSAQAGLYLPWIEQRRIDLLPKLRGLVQFPLLTADGQVERIEDLSIGQLSWALRDANLSSMTLQTIARLRRARNLLAHLQPLPPELALHEDLMK